MSAEELYAQYIMEHSRDKRNRREVPGATHVHRGVNPSCGDEITLQVRAENGVIADVGFTGEGCAISQASASMMSDLMRGRTVEDANRICAIFLGMIRGEELSGEQLDELEEAIALQGVSKKPARVKCATLPWHTYGQLSLSAAPPDA